MLSTERETLAKVGRDDTKNLKQDHPVGVNRRVNLNITCMR